MKNVHIKISESGLSGIYASEDGEYVCNVNDGTQENKVSISVLGKASKSDQEKVDTLTASIKALGCDELKVAI